MPCRNLALLALPLIVSGCAAGESPGSANPAAGVPEARVIGAGQNCIMRDEVRQSVVRSAQVIDFELHSGKVFRNTLTSPCPGLTLTLDRTIANETSINQLCRQQIVYALQNVGGVLQRGAGCSLGDFVPVEYVKQAKGK